MPTLRLRGDPFGNCCSNKVAMGPRGPTTATALLPCHRLFSCRSHLACARRPSATFRTTIATMVALAPSGRRVLLAPTAEIAVHASCRLRPHRPPRCRRAYRQTFPCATTRASGPRTTAATTAAPAQNTPAVTWAPTAPTAALDSFHLRRRHLPLRHLRLRTLRHAPTLTPRPRLHRRPTIRPIAAPAACFFLMAIVTMEGREATIRRATLARIVRIPKPASNAPYPALDATCTPHPLARCTLSPRVFSLKCAGYDCGPRIMKPPSPPPPQLPPPPPLSPTPSGHLWEIIHKSGDGHCHLISNGTCVTDGAGVHGSNEECSFRAVEPLYASATEFHLEKHFDFVKIGYIRYSGETGPTGEIKTVFPIPLAHIPLSPWAAYKHVISLPSSQHPSLSSLGLPLAPSVHRLPREPAQRSQWRRARRSNSSPMGLPTMQALPSAALQLRLWRHPLHPRQ